MSSKVRIVNPVPGGSSSTSWRAARAYCDRGSARFVAPGEIEFLPERQVRMQRILQEQHTRSQRSFDPVDGSFSWRASVSAGFAVMTADHG